MKDPILLNYRGKIQSLTEWSRQTGISRHTLYRRIFRCRMPLDIAFNPRSLKGLRKADWMYL